MYGAVNMALSAKLQSRQIQSLALTPQLLQSIRLLQLNQIELSTHILEEVEKNPLLELVDESQPEADDSVDRSESAGLDGFSAKDGELPIISGTDFDSDIHSIESRLDTSLENVFDIDNTGIHPANQPSPGTGASHGQAGPVSYDLEAPDLEKYCMANPDLGEFLRAQLPLALRDSRDAMLGTAIIDSLDEDGYLRRSLQDIADSSGTSRERVEQVLAVVQTFDPPGIAARNLAECLSIQLAGQNRLDPPMCKLLENLPLLARRDFVALAEICDISQDKLLAKVREIRALDPRPGDRFNFPPIQPAVPDIFVSRRADGSWSLELNTSILPKVLVNREYLARVSQNCHRESDRTFLADRLQEASFLVRSLDQRAKTILKIAAEIVRQQASFLEMGIDHLKPLNLRMVADAVNMHESTVSRVTSGKYMMTGRGLFELKYFFTAAVPAVGNDNLHSAEAVRHRIRKLIEAEPADAVLSDDNIVDLLRQSGIEIARRTVAKYRESLEIPSSVQRRREKRAFRMPDHG
jgi:RNA polymerase sigma-54 factor